MTHGDARSSDCAVSGLADADHAGILVANLAKLLELDPAVFGRPDTV